MAVLFRQEHRHAEGAAPWHDGDLVELVVFRHAAPDDGVARLVVGGVAPLLLRHDHRFALGAHHDLVLGLLEIVHVHEPLAEPCGEKRGLVDDVLQVGAAEARRAARDHGRIDVFRDRHVAHVHLHDLLAPADVRQRHDHLAVEAPRTQQRRIEDVRAVGRGDDDDAVVRLEAVHLHEKLVQRLFALVVAAAEASAPVPAHGVDLVDEDDARRLLLGLLEHVAHPRRAHADEHLHEVRAGDGEERHLRFAGDGARQQRLAGAGRADHQRAARDAPAQALELARVAQELDQLLHVFLGLVDAGDIREGGLDLFLGEQARLALAEGHRVAAPAEAALHLPHQQHEHGDDDENGEAGDEQLRPEALLLRLLAFHVDVGVEQVVEQLRVAHGWQHHAELLVVVARRQHFRALEGDRGDMTVAHLLDERRVGLLALLVDDVEGVEDRHQNDTDDQPKQKIFAHVVQGFDFLGCDCAALVQLRARRAPHAPSKKDAMETTPFATAAPRAVLLLAS